MPDTPLNPDALEAGADAVIDASFGQELPEAPIDLATAAVSAYLAVAQPEVNSVEQWDALPIGTMVRVHVNGNSELIIRCPDASGSGVGGMSFIGGKHWDGIYTDWNADKIEILYRPEVKP